MAKQPKDDRTQAERRFAELQQSAKSVKDYTELERQALRAKTARLKDQRLEKEAADIAAKPEKKPVKARKKPTT